MGDAELEQYYDEMEGKESTYQKEENRKWEVVMSKNNLRLGV